MKFQTLLLFSLCLFASHAVAEENPIRDFTMVDLHNRLTATILEVGKTSFTFSVEWPLDTEFDCGQLELMGKLKIERRGWSFLEDLRVDPTQGKAIFEILYADLLPLSGGGPDFSQKAFFAVRIPIDTGALEGPSRGRYEEDDEVDDKEDEEASPVATAEAGGQDGGQGGAVPSPTGSSDGSQPSGQADTTGTTAGDRNRLWLYAVIALALCAVFYFVRKKFSKNS